MFFYLMDLGFEDESNFFFKLGFTPCKAEQPLWGMELQEKEAQKDERIQEIHVKRTYS